MAFLDAYNVLKGFEGGLANNPYDRGGPTAFGVSSKYFPDDYAAVMALVESGQDPEQYLQNFYKTNFWDAIGADNLPPELQTIAFDTAVNSGPQTAQKILAQANGDPNTFLDARQNYVDQIIANNPTQAEFQEGWSNRINALRPQDFSGLSDAELAEIAGVQIPQSDFSGLSDAELAEIAGITLEQPNLTETAVVDNTVPETQERINPVVRTLGRTGRNLGAGLSSLLDLGLLIPKTAALGAGMGLEKLGAEGVGSALQELGATPTMRDTFLSSIDRATNNQLQPQNTTEKVFDFGAELISSAVPFSRADDLANPNAVNALTSLLDPQEALQRSNILSQPLNVTPKITLPDMAKLTAPQLKAEASKLYQQAADQGGTITPQKVDSFLDDIASKVVPKDEKVLGLGAGKTSKNLLDEIKSVYGNKPLTLEEAQNLDEFLTEKIDDFVEMGVVKKEGKRIQDIQRSLREMIESVGPDDVDNPAGFEALKKGRELWSRSRRLADVERVLQRAQYMDQPGNAIKTGLRTILTNPSKSRGFTKDEIKALEKAMKTGLEDDLLRTFGSRLMNFTGSAIGAGIGGPAGAVLGGAATSAGTGAARSVGLNRQMQRTDALLDLIAGRPVNPQYPSVLTNKGALATIGAGANAMNQNAPLRVTVPVGRSALRELQ